MEKNHDNRQVVYFQKYTAEPKTLALCEERHDASPGLVEELTARIRITKEDRRLPLFVVIAFEPKGGNPDGAEIVVAGTPTITVTELQLLNRSYVPILRDIGNPRPGGPIAFPCRKGTLGIAVEIHPDCDAVDIRAYLLPAMGELKSDSGNERWGGRWSVTYTMTCNDRLSREEWTAAIQQTNMQVELNYYNPTGSGVTPTLTTARGE
jgi:hypothetical protein